jgi:rhamnosyltransferase
VSIPPTVSVVIRAKDEDPAIGRCLDLLHAQELSGRELELIVVDSGSRDGTVALARGRGARVIEIPAASFTFGGALNTGCAAARGEIIVALSAHAYVHERDWLARLLATFDDPRVACACGQLYRPDGGPLTEPLVQDLALSERLPFWGYSNAAGGFRAELWRRHPFDDRMPGTEDQAWARHWMREGYVVYVDPALWVDHDHSKDPLPSMFRRARREREGYEMFLDLPPVTLRSLLGEWWSDQASYRSSWRARLSHRRAARLLGAYAGSRRAHSNRRA